MGKTYLMREKLIVFVAEKVQVLRKKYKNFKGKLSCPHTPLFPGSAGYILKRLISNSSPALSSAGEWSMEGCGQYIAVHLLSPHTFPLFQHGVPPIEYNASGWDCFCADFPQTADPPGNVHLLQQGSSRGCSVVTGSTLLLSMGCREALALAPAAPPPPSLIHVFTLLFLIVFFSLLCMGRVLALSQIHSRKCQQLAWQVHLCPVAGLLQNGLEPAGTVSGMGQPWLPLSKVIPEAVCCQYLATDTSIEKLFFQFVWLYVSFSLWPQDKI